MARSGDRNAERVERSEVRRRVALLIDELDQLPTIDYADPAQMRERCRHHRIRCMEMDLMPTVGTLVVALGISMDQLNNLARGEQSSFGGVKLTRDSANILQKELAMLECAFDANFENGSYANPVTGIFAAKNLYGWKDTRDIQQQSVTIEVTPEQIEARYVEAVPLHVDPQGEVRQLREGVSARATGKKAKRLRARVEGGDFPEYEPPEE